MENCINDDSDSSSSDECDNESNGSDNGESNGYFVNHESER